MELERFKIDEFEYHLGHTVYNIDDLKVSFPWIEISNKSAKKKRSKNLGDKVLMKYRLLQANNPKEEL